VTPLTQSHRIVVPEPVSFGNYPALKRSACRSIDDAPEGVPIEVSFEQHRSGSIGVALMIALFRYAHASNRTIRFVEVPGDLRNIIEVADLEDVLPVEGLERGTAATLVPLESAGD